MFLNKSPLCLFWYELMFRIFGKKYSAIIDITDRCNLRCKYCYHRKCLKKEDNTSLAEWEERFREYCGKGIRKVGFTGGEPSLRYDVLKLAEKYFPFIATFTNGQIKIPKEFQHRIFLSLDGTKKYHEMNRGKGTYERVVNNYRGDKRVLVHPVISKENYKDLRNFIDEIRKMNIQGVIFSFYSPQKDEDNSLVLDEKERQEARRVLLEELKRKDSILLMTEDMIDFLVNRESARRCAAKERLRFFTADGKLKYCASEATDCSRCGSFCAYMLPKIWNILGWLRSTKRLGEQSLKIN